MLAGKRVRQRVLEQQAVVREVLHTAQVAGAAGELDRVEISGETPTGPPVLDSQMCSAVMVCG